MARVSYNANNVTFLPRARDFIDEFDLDPEMFLSVVRAPETIARDPSSGDAGYPILRLRRGDLIVVLGLRDPENPSILFVYISLDNAMHTTGGKYIKGGGSGSQMPTSVNQIKGWAQSHGCNLVRARQGTRIEYQGQFVGLLHETPHTSGAALANTFTRLRRNLAAAKARHTYEQEKADG